MQCFIPKTKLDIKAPKLTRNFIAASVDNKFSYKDLWVDVGGESKLVSDKLISDLGIQPGPNAVQEVLTMVGEPYLTTLDNFPPRIGRVTSKLVSNAIELIETKDCWRDQFYALSKKKNSNIFNIAVVNAFGSNLGDVTLGMTALRIFASVLSNNGYSVTFELLTGPGAADSISNIIGDEEFISGVLRQGPSLFDFCKYDAFIDFTGLVALPKIDEMATIDWLIWWLGLDPAMIKSVEKRNKMNIPTNIMSQVRNLLRDVQGQKIFFNPRASVPLRSIPEKIATQMVKKLLKLNSSIKIIIDQPLNIKDSRVVDVSKQITSAELFIALVANVDGVISVDSFAPQLADACSIPCAHLLATLPTEFYPYYPYSKPISISGAPELPYFRKFKVPDGENWDQHKQKYEKAWKALDVKLVLADLSDMIKKRKRNHAETNLIQKITSRPQFAKYWIRTAGNATLRGCHSREIVNIGQDLLAKMSQTLLRTGMTVCVTTPPNAATIIELSKILSHSGRINIFEPREDFSKLLGSELVLSNSRNYSLSNSAPFIGPAEVPAVNPYSAMDVETWGNTSVKDKILGEDGILDILFNCDVLIINKPTPLDVLCDQVNNLESRRGDPLIIVPHLRTSEAKALLDFSNGNEYKLMASELSAGNKDELLFLAAPRDSSYNFEGFIKVQ